VDAVRVSTEKIIYLSFFVDKSGRMRDNTVMKLSDNKNMEVKKTFKIVVAFEGYDTYTVEASSEEEAQEIVLSGETDDENTISFDRYEENFEVVESKEV
jgi:PDZ domain-containing secreted protein